MVRIMDYAVIILGYDYFFYYAMDIDHSTYLGHLLLCLECFIDSRGIFYLFCKLRRMGISRTINFIGVCIQFNVNQVNDN